MFFAIFCCCCFLFHKNIIPFPPKVTGECSLLPRFISNHCIVLVRYTKTSISSISSLWCFFFRVYATINSWFSNRNYAQKFLCAEKIDNKKQMYKINRYTFSSPAAIQQASPEYTQRLLSKNGIYGMVYQYRVRNSKDNHGNEIERGRERTQKIRNAKCFQG